MEETVLNFFKANQSQKKGINITSLRVFKKRNEDCHQMTGKGLDLQDD